MKKLILFLAVFPLLEAAHVDLSAYPFSSVLRNDDSSGEVVYQVYWDFDTEAETSAFAVRVRTAGWVGFGLSPNGGMIGSDVVIGWVDGSGTVFFNVSKIALQSSGYETMHRNSKLNMEL